MLFSVLQYCLGFSEHLCCFLFIYFLVNLCVVIFSVKSNTRISRAFYEILLYLILTTIKHCVHLFRLYNFNKINKTMLHRNQQLLSIFTI